MNHAAAPEPETNAAPPGVRGAPLSVEDGGLDPGLLRGARAGDPAAIDAWFRAEHAPIYRLSFGLLADADAAADVAQDALLRLLDKLDRYDPARPWRAWRDTVVVRLCRDQLRRRAARARVEQGGGEQAAREAARAAPASPGAGIEEQETRALVAAALDGLGEREREAFVLRDLEGLSTRDAADAMGVGASTVRSLLTLARRRLRDRLAPKLGPDLGSRIEGGGAA